MINELVRATELYNENIYELQIGASFYYKLGQVFYYKLGLTLLPIGAASLLQTGTSVVTNWGSYYKLWQLLLQNSAAIKNGAKCFTNWGRCYKFGHNKCEVL